MISENEKIIIYGIKNCDTIKKTKIWFDLRKIAYTFHDFKTLGCEKSIALSMLKEFGHQTLINRRGTTWRKIPQIEREAITDETAANLIVNFPSLIKRPVIKRKTTWLIGYDELAFERICPPIHDI